MSKGAAIVAICVVAIAGAAWLGLRHRSGSDEAVTQRAPAAAPAEVAAAATESPRAAGTARPGHARAEGAAATGPVDLVPPGPQHQRPPETVGREGPVSEARQVDDWSTVPMDPASAAGESLGTFETRKDFSIGMKEGRPVVLSCMRSWKPPPGIVQYEAKVELRVRGVENAFIVEDAIVQAENVALAEMEACLAQSYIGRRIESAGAVPGKRYRLQWGVVFYYGG